MLRWVADGTLTMENITEKLSGQNMPAMVRPVIIFMMATV